MKHPSFWLVAPLGVLLAAVLAVAAFAGVGRSPIYSVAAVQAGLARDPQAWLGRTVLVRGVVEPCLGSGSLARFLHCHRQPQDRLDPDPATEGGSLPLVSGSQNVWLAFLRHLPLMDRVLPPQQTPQWRTLATYRVQLRAMPAGDCTGQPYYEALLLDAAP